MYNLIISSMATRLIEGFFHCAPSSVQDLLENERHRLFKHDTLTDYLETIRQKLSYKKWYAYSAPAVS